MQVVSKKDQKSELAKQKLLEATKAIIEEYGIRYLTVRNVCEQSGVSSGSLYHHFGTKENLICAYIEKLYEQVDKKNPVPDYVKQKAHFGMILWPFLVYAKFCEALGQETVRFLFSDCDQDFFEKAHFQSRVAEQVTELFSPGGSLYHPKVRVDLNAVNVDLTMLYKGVIISWCVASKKIAANFERSVCENMEHLIFRFLLSFASDAFRKKIQFGDLITEQADFASYFDMSDVAIRN